MIQPALGLVIATFELRRESYRLITREGRDLSEEARAALGVATRPMGMTDRHVQCSGPVAIEMLNWFKDHARGIFQRYATTKRGGFSDGRDRKPILDVLADLASLIFPRGEAVSSERVSTLGRLTLVSQFWGTWTTFEPTGGRQQTSSSQSYRTRRASPIGGLPVVSRRKKNPTLSHWNSSASLITTHSSPDALERRALMRTEHSPSPAPAARTVVESPRAAPPSVDSIHVRKPLRPLSHGGGDCQEAVM